MPAIKHADNSVLAAILSPMLRIAFCISTLFITQALFSQTTVTPILVSEKKFKGAIFPEGYEVSIAFGAERLQRRFTPDASQIRIAEEGFVNQYNNLRHANVSDVANYFKGYRRQYLGYVNYKGDSVILSQFIDLGSSLAFKRRNVFADWKQHFISCLSDFCYRYLRLYHYNLSTNKLEVL